MEAKFHKILNFMRYGRYIYIMSDVYGYFDELNQLIDREIRQNKILKTLAPRWQADWVIFHTAPKIFDDVETQMREMAGYRHLTEPSRKMLAAVFERYRLKKWFFGISTITCRVKQKAAAGKDWQILMGPERHG